MLPGALSGLRPAECGSHPAGAWYCVQARIRREHEVRDRLGDQGFGTFLPLVAVRRRDTVQAIAAFPGYLFVRFSLVTDRWRAIYSTRGVRRLFSADEHPIPVPEAAISTLLALGYDRPIVALPQIEALDEALAPGARLRIGAGPFAGRDGVCVWSSRQRVALLVEIMGATRTVRVARNAVGAT